MKGYLKLLPVAVLLATVGLQAGCDRNEAITDSESSASDVAGKFSTTGGLGQELVADKDFQALRVLLFDAGQKARGRYLRGANLKADQAFARAAGKKKVLSESDKARLLHIRGLTDDEFHRIAELRAAIVKRFPEILTLSKEELQDVLAGAGVGKNDAVGKTLDKCSDCNYYYNSCLSTAEIRYAIEATSCALLVETLWGGTVCYLAALSEYMWTVTSCNQVHNYCLSAAGCLGTAKDTL